MMKRCLLLIGLVGVMACAHFTAVDNLDASDASVSDGGLTGEPDVSQPKKTYTVSTLAGTGEASAQDGPALQATFNNPAGIALGPNGSLYVTDQYNNKIRKIAADGTVSTYAGNGNAGLADGNCADATFNSPYGISVDPAGYVYVADYANHAIRKIIPTPTCWVSTLAGAGPSNPGASDGMGTAASFNYPVGLTLDAASGNIYVADSRSNKIRLVTRDGAVSTYAGTGTAGNVNGRAVNATFNYPWGILVDAGGTLYVSEYRNNDIRMITSDLQVSTLAGSGARGPLIDGTGTDASFASPFGIRIDANGNLLVGDTYNNAVRQVSPTGEVTTIAGQRAASNVGVAGDNDGPADTATFHCPQGVAMNAGTIYIADSLNNKIRKLE
ncbi:MAG: NHL repeat-containing protein [Polyangiaceae bacterium]|nr:NHL repeat-containing protein [Polyangiaceae bacterium]